MKKKHLIFFITTVCSILGIVLGWQALTDKPNITVESFPYEGGIANLFADNVAITALHCIENEEEILYSDENRDIAIISTDRKFSEVANTYKLKVSKEPSMHTDITILPGDSGQVYIENDTVYGVKLGYNKEGALVATITEDIYENMCKFIERNNSDEQ